MLTSLLVGSLIAVLGAWGLGRVAGASQGVLVAMAPKSATGPIAMAIAESLGGSPSLTMAVVLLTGIFGAIVAPAVFKLLRIEDDAQNRQMWMLRMVLGTLQVGLKNLVNQLFL